MTHLRRDSVNGAESERSNAAEIQAMVKAARTAVALGQHQVFAHF
jgi:hypothetical protein